jgi:hypothetical protein
MARIESVDDGALTASYGGLRTLASTYDHEAAALLGWCGLPTETMASPALLASAPLSPLTFVEAEAAVLACTADLAVQAGRWEADAVAVRATVAAYQLADGGAAELLGYALGPGVSSIAGSTTREVLELLPSLPDGVREQLARLAPSLTGDGAAATPGAGVPAGGEGLLDRLQRLLTSHPALTAEAISFTAGALNGLTEVRPGVRIGAAGLAGAYGPETGEITRERADLSGAAHAPGSLAETVDDLHRVSALADSDHGNDGTLAITQVRHPDGSRSWIVDVPGTDMMDPVRSLAGPDVRDMAENLRYVAGQPTAYSRGVLDAMGQAGIGRGEPVMLVGHSQGGMTVQSIVQDASGYDVRQVVTAGSPDIPGSMPDTVRALQLEHDGDLVPELDGHTLPDASPSHLTVTFDSGVHGIVDNHSYDDYTAGAGAVDVSGDHRLTAQLAAMRADGFLGDDPATTRVYQITRVRG